MDRFAAARAAFEALADLAAAERITALAELQASDPALAAQVAELLRLDQALDGPLDRPLLDLAGDATPGAPTAGDRVGAYRLCSLLGRGGMGEVWLAERADEQFAQQVAIKVLKPGMDSAEVLRRFRRERQILASLEHPNIARLYDGGVTDAGRPYFVMERIEGEPLTVHVARRQPTLEERVRLVATCCDAVAAAHRRLVVHRDLKPSNVMVTADGELKLLDFGIAKLLGEEAPDATSATARAASRFLTPAYAAPEQILGEAETTATDVYALGVLLYEVLTGSLPGERTTGSLAELVSRATQESVERPSAALRRRGEGDERGRRRLARRLEGDLDTIVLTAMRREPERRYPTATALADDLRRHLEGLPVHARPETLRYRAGKFVRRHRVGVAAAALAVASLLAGLGVALWQARIARQQALRAATHALRAERVKEFLIGLFEVADPEQSGGAGVTAAEILAQAGNRLGHELASEPDVQADLLETVARIDRSLGRFATAEQLAGRALALRRGAAPDRAAEGSAQATLGAVQLAQGKLDEAEANLRAGLALLGAGEDGGGLAAARARSDLAQVAFWRSHLDEAERGEQQAYAAYRQALGEDHVLTAIHRRNLGVVRYQQLRYDEAERDLRASQAVLERHLGAEHPNLAQSHLNLAALLEDRGRPDEAEPLYRRALAIRRRELGDSHPATGQSLQLLGLLLVKQGRYEESAAAYREALALFTAIDPHHFEVGKARNGLGLIASKQGRHAEAEREMAAAVAVLRRALGEDHPFVWQGTSNLGMEVAAQGRLGEAVVLQRRACERLRALSGPESDYTAGVEVRLGTLLRRRGEAAAARSLHQHALAALGKLYGEEHLEVASARWHLAQDLVALGEGERAAAELRRAEQSLAGLAGGPARLEELRAREAAPPVGGR